MDFGELYAYTAVDIYTREAQVVLLPGLTGQDGRRALELVMAYFGSCEVLQTDGGKEFMGEFEEKVGCYAQRHRMARPYRKHIKCPWGKRASLRGELSPHFAHRIGPRRGKNALAGASISPARGKNYRRRPENT